MKNVNAIIFSVLFLTACSSGQNAASSIIVNSPTFDDEVSQNAESEISAVSFVSKSQPEGFDVFAGSEVFLLPTLRGGGAGCITATGNVNPAPMIALYKSWQGAQADAQQARLDITRAAFQKYSMIPAMKAAIAKYGKKDSWKTVRPPLIGLNAEQEKALLDSLEVIGFHMSGV